MADLFLKIINMSISASWIVLAVLVLRLVLKKAPKWITVLLWGIVAVRLICPLSIESIMSLMPSAETISPQVLIETPEINTGISILNNTLNPIIQEGTIAVAPEKSINILQLFVLIFSKVWIIGIAGMLLYTGISYFRVKNKIGTAVLLRENVFQSENVVSPFVLGIIKPKIYLPFQMNEQDMEHVIAHEQAHIRRKDHLWKPLGFLILTLHWFNPMVWLGYVLLCRDIELACDEKVIKELNAEQKADYSQALLTCSVNRRIIAACPLAFGEVGVKDRVKSVLNYKKPAFWVVAVAIVASIVVAVCFLTNPKTTIDDELAVFLDMQIAEHHYSEEHTDDNFIAVSQKMLGVDKSYKKITVYMWVLYHEYSYENGALELETGAHIPTVITAKRTGSHGHYELVEYWEPRDGSYYAKDIKKKFPWYLHGKALDSQRYIGEQEAFCDNAAKEYFASNEVINTEFEGVYITLESCKADEGGQTHFEVVWHNETEEEVTYGEMFTVEYKPGEEWMDTDFNEERYFNTIGYSLKKNNTNTKIYTAEHLDISKSGTYRFMVPFSIKEGNKYISYKTWAEFNVGEVISLPNLKEKYPQFFNVSTDGGLTVYIWQMSKENYSCHLANTALEAISDNSFAYKVGATIPEMRAILTMYDIDKKDIAVQPVINPLSSYCYEIDDAYKTNIKKLFWSTIPHVDSNNLNKAIAKVLSEKYRADKPDGLLHIESSYLLANETASGTPLLGNSGHMEEATVYLIVHHMKYSVNGGQLKEVAGGFIPTVITFSIDEKGGHSLKEYWTPRSGENYEKDIRAKFPGASAEEALHMDKYAEGLTKESWRKATESLNKINSASSIGNNG